ncbi:hypothetical protein HMPREF3215_01568 [Staphylococcus simulans]|nr:hypothetical protein HMPREF3215_01568 [Staphylococcus simulans]
MLLKFDDQLMSKRGGTYASPLIFIKYMVIRVDIFRNMKNFI